MTGHNKVIRNFFLFFYISSIFFLILEIKGTFAQNQIEPEDIKKSVVEIYNQNKELIGTGSSISFSGLIISSKHILEDTASGGSIAPNYLLKILVRQSESSIYEEAELLSIHPFMDIAILAKRGGAPIPPLSINNSIDLDIGTDIVIVGHRQSGNIIYKTKTAKIDEISRDGHIIASRMVERGTSGGPALCKNRLIGIIRSTGVDYTTIVPIDRALDYFQLMGIKFSDEGYAYESDDIAKLASKAELYEQIITDIQIDYTWVAEIKPIKSDGQTLMLTDKTIIGIEISKKLSTQPNLEAKIELFAIPIFKNNQCIFSSDKKRVGFTRSEWLKYDDNKRVEFDNIKKEVQGLIRKYENSNPNFSIEDLSGLDLHSKISTMDGKGFIRRPSDIGVCFDFSSIDKELLNIDYIRKSGFRCNFE